MLISKNVPIQISGVLINSSNGYPLARLHVKVLIANKIHSGNQNINSNNHREILIGESVSDHKGHFEINSISAIVSSKFQNLLILNKNEEIFVILRVYNAINQSKPISEHMLDLNSCFSPITLTIPLSRSPISRTVWHEVGRKMRLSRLIQINSLARQLCGVPIEQSLFSDLNLETRQSLLTELEEAFLDPKHILSNISKIPSFYILHDSNNLQQYYLSLQSVSKKKKNTKSYVGDFQVQEAYSHMCSKLNTFSDLFDVDWAIDVIKLQEGKIGKAIMEYEDLYTTATRSKRRR